MHAVFVREGRSHVAFAERTEYRNFDGVHHMNSVLDFRSGLCFLTFLLRLTEPVEHMFYCHHCEASRLVQHQAPTTALPRPAAGVAQV